MRKNNDYLKWRKIIITILILCFVHKSCHTMVIEMLTSYILHFLHLKSLGEEQVIELTASVFNWQWIQSPGLVFCIFKSVTYVYMLDTANFYPKICIRPIPVVEYLHGALNTILSGYHQSLRVSRYLLSVTFWWIGKLHWLFHNEHLCQMTINVRLLAFTHDFK